MKALLISSIAFLGLAALGLALLCQFNTGDSDPEEVIKPTSLPIKRQISSPERKGAFRAIFGESRGEISLETVPPDRGKKVDPPGKFRESEKNKEESSPAGVNRILVAGIPVKDIPHQSKEELEEFLDKLEEVSKRRDTNDGKGQAQEIFFSTFLPDLKTGVPVTSEYFSPSSLRIFASFDSARETFRGLDRVLVKWFNPQGQSDMFQYLPITPNENYNYIWRELNYWEPGIYNVEIYQVAGGQDLKILASGSFFVQDLKEYFSYPGLYRDLSQSLSQLDFVQGDPIYVKLNYSSRNIRSLILTVKDFNNGNPLSSREMAIPAASQVSVYLLKGPSQSLPKGVFWLELSTRDGLLVGRTKFGIN